MPRCSTIAVLAFEMARASQFAPSRQHLASFPRHPFDVGGSAARAIHFHPFPFPFPMYDCSVQTKLRALDLSAEVLDRLANVLLRFSHHRLTRGLSETRTSRLQIPASKRRRMESGPSDSWGSVGTLRAGPVQFGCGSKPCTLINIAGKWMFIHPKMEKSMLCNPWPFGAGNHREPKNAPTQGTPSELPGKVCYRRPALPKPWNRKHQHSLQNERPLKSYISFRSFKVHFLRLRVLSRVHFRRVGGWVASLEMV